MALEIAGLLEVGDGEVVTSASIAPKEELHQKGSVTRRVAVAAAVAGGLLLALNLMHSSGMVPAITSHILGLNEEGTQDPECSKWEKAFVKAAERSGFMQLEDMVLQEGCNVNVTSDWCLNQQEELAGLFPPCEEKYECFQAEVTFSLKGENITITVPRDGQGKGAPIEIKQVLFKMSRHHEFPTACKAQLKWLVEGGEDAPASLFNSTDFCQMHISGLPVPTVMPCSVIEEQTAGNVTCNRFEKFMGHKLRMHTVGFRLQQIARELSSMSLE